MEKIISATDKCFKIKADYITEVFDMNGRPLGFSYNKASEILTILSDVESVTVHYLNNTDDERKN